MGTSCPVYSNAKDDMKANLEILYAVELLEYHNKNWLSGDNKTRCESKITLLKHVLKEAGHE